MLLAAADVEKTPRESLTSSSVDQNSAAPHQASDQNFPVLHAPLRPAATDLQGWCFMKYWDDTLLLEEFFSRVQSNLNKSLLDVDDLESVLLEEESPTRASNPPAGVQQAWEQELQMWLLF